MNAEANAFTAWALPSERDVRIAKGYQTLFFSIWVAIGFLAFIVFSSFIGYLVAVIAASLVIGKRTVTEQDTKIMWTLAWVELFALFGRFLVVHGLLPVALAVFVAGVLAIWLRRVQ